MLVTRHHQRPLYRPWAVWLAVLLALFAALAPAVSHALALERGTQGIEICTGTGTQIIPADSPTGPEPVLHVDHCPFCLHSADRFAPPPTPVAYLFLGLGGQQEVAVWQAFFYVSHFYPRAAPRGPPSYS